MRTTAAHRGYRLLGTPSNDLEGIDFQEFSSVLPLLGGDLQTFGSLWRRRRFIPDPAAQSVRLALGSGDEALMAQHDSPFNTQNVRRDLPLVVLLHGLGGNATSAYMVEASDYFRAQGMEVLRLELRGSGASANTTNGIYNAGISDDLRLALKSIPPVLSENGVMLCGFSLGANVVLKYLGEGDVHDSVLGGVAISPPLDLARTQERIAAFRNRLYRRYLMARIRADYENANWSVIRAPLDDVAQIKSIIEFDDRVVAPLYGFAGAAHYYAESSCGRYLSGIKLPTLIVHAETDPWIPASLFEDGSFPWSKSTTVAMTSDGGHVGFSARCSPYSWYLPAAGIFLKQKMSRD